MSNTSHFKSLLQTIRKTAFTQHDKGNKFERIMKLYLQTDPNYAYKFKNVWLWNEFPAKKDFGGKDTGIDLVALTHEGDYWAIQCKCYAENAAIDKPEVDSFLSTSSRTFTNDNFQTVGFAHRLWISTTNNWGANAQEAIKNQNPPVSRINLYDLEQAPVDWEVLESGAFGEPARLARKSPRLHQLDAINNTHEHFLSQQHDRGKIIMACGTGKTFTSLKIAENETNGKGLVLFLVPSIALLGQTLREWTAQASEPINAICICSDSGVSKNSDDSDDSSIIDLALPASTDVKNILKQFEYIKQRDKQGMTVVFSTYQSIEVIAQSQQALLKQDRNFGIFDLIICDEAHRTTGVTIAGKDESSFVKVHDNSFIKARKRLYMTATPRIFNDSSKNKADKFDATLCSMDDVNLYGEEMYRIGFGEAVEKGLLTDYKVLILTVSEDDISPELQKKIKDTNQEFSADDASNLIGCISALSKQVLGDAGLITETDPEPMRRAVAFCSNISDSKQVTRIFNDTKDTYTKSLTKDKQDKLVSVSSRHVDGKMSVIQRNEHLEWLKATPEDPKECRILTNARCLSEGVDVPSLDAVLFLSTRNSQVDVVQSVGRVMRLAEGKKYGYIIIPIFAASTAKGEDVLAKSDDYKVVWTVLNALRAHDDRFNATVNKIELNKKRSNKVTVGRPNNGGYTEGGSGATTAGPSADELIQMSLDFEKYQDALFAKMVEKVGDRRYWEQWAKDVAQIAERYILRITRLVNEDKKHGKAFNLFLSGLQKNINPSITQEEAIEMLSQHIITKPVFEALFEGYSFVKNNPISVSMQKMLDLLEDQSFDKDAETLQKFYDSVKERAGGIDNSEGKQKIIVELYDKFFKTAFPKMVEQLGIVYTPIEVVDFMVHSVDAILQKEFNRSISDENVHILDPFTGTGTFMTRLLQSGLIKAQDLQRKYSKELHANEIVLLAYYIAAINIENTFHDLLMAQNPDTNPTDVNYIPFEGICLTDTFQLGESDLSEKMFSEMFPQNSDRVIAQKKAPLRVIIGNPPYSVGQKSANDNAQNQSYPILDAKIANSYAKESNAGLNKSLYDSYIKAFRWSSDRLDKDNGGIIAFVSNGAWLDGNSTDGFRKCLEMEFSTIYVFNLRGNQRTSGELSRKEGGKIFGSGSRTPISISFLVKKPISIKGQKATIHYHDIGDYLKTEEKLNIIKKFSSVANKKMEWVNIQPNEYGDWISQRNDIFSTYISLASEKKNSLTTQSFFNINAVGVNTARDFWVYNFCYTSVEINMKSMIDFYNQELQKTIGIKKSEIGDTISSDARKISWSANLKKDLENGKQHFFVNTAIIKSNYRPFCKQNLYFHKSFIERTGRNEMLYPNIDLPNFTICISPSANDGIAVLLSDKIANFHFNGDTQCFPLYYYEEVKTEQTNLFDTNHTKYQRRDAISDFILKQARQSYSNIVTKEDIFYYVYGFLHSPEYRELFADDLKKMLPRIPLVAQPTDFWSFSKAGRKLAKLHVDYENVPPAEGVIVKGAESGFFKVEKMRFASKQDKSVIYYNSKIIIENIPDEAYQYQVNGKSAIDWIVERYQVTTHKDSGIKNDPNDWAEEVGNPRYILDLLLSIIRVSTETVEIINKLPKVSFE
ncbi:MAG: DEAD/DEAH box helicase family protein [Flectobacillus sp.]|nr:DEAD/DEAH box helicase family protein [Flectobacillus sp.]